MTDQPHEHDEAIIRALRPMNSDSIAEYADRYRAVYRAGLEAGRADAEYYKWRLTEILPLFEEARDALPAITLVSAKLHGVDLSLGARMDAAGTRTREQFDATHRGKE